MAERIEERIVEQLIGKYRIEDILEPKSIIVTQKYLCRAYAICTGW